MPAGSAPLDLHTRFLRPITRADVPETLLGRRGVTVRFHPTGHLAHVNVRGNRYREGRLELDIRVGTGRFFFLGHAGGSGIAVDEVFRDGQIHSTLSTPWHDGEVSSEPADWRDWVLGALASLVSIA